MVLKSLIKYHMIVTTQENRKEAKSSPAGFVL